MLPKKKLPNHSSAENAVGRSAGSGVLKNLLSNTTTTALAMLVGVWYTPYMLDQLPAYAYGLVPLATSIASYLSVVTVSVAGAVGRFVAADHARGDLAAANRTLNAFFFMGLAAIGLLLAVAAIFIALLPVKVPEELKWQARILFMAIFGSLMLTMPQAVFDVAVWITSRFELRALSDITGLIVRLGLIVSIFSFAKPEVWHVGVSIHLGTWASLCVMYLAFRRLTPELRISPEWLDRQRMRSVARSSSWMVLNQLANILSMGFDMFLINRVLGTEANAKYSVVLVWITALRSAFSAGSAVLAPRMVMMESTGQTGQLIHLSLLNARLQGAAAAAVMGTMSGLAPWLFAVWLRKPWTAEVAPIAWVLLTALTIEACSMPFGAIMTAESRMREVSIATAAIGVFGAATGWALASYTSLGMLGIALAVGLTALLRHGLYAPLFVAQALSADRWSYLGIWAWTLVRGGLHAAMAYSIGRYFEPQTRIPVVATGILAGSTALLVGYSLMGSNERLALRKLFRLT